jgi:hypothetical protein
LFLTDRNTDPGLPVAAIIPPEHASSRQVFAATWSGRYDRPTNEEA